MLQKNLTQKTGMAAFGIGMLVQSMMPYAASGGDSSASGIFFNKRTQEYEVNRPLPDTAMCDYLGKKPPIDKFKNIPGAETTYFGYQCGDTQLVLYALPNKKVYGFSLITKDNPYTWFWDYENDGNFEQEGRNGRIDVESYGYLLNKKPFLP
jgi:hypothetical protein